MIDEVASDKQYYPLFDYLRISLAIIVMLGHDGLIGWEESGNFAVQVFFALSGWLIGGMLMEMSTRELPRFYFNRAMRIWIPYYLALLLLVAASLLKDHLTPKWFEFVFYKTSFVYNIFGPSQLAEFVYFMPLQGTGNHFWSVNAEEQFYLLAPLLLVVFAPLGRSVVIWIALAIAAWWFEIYSSIVLGVLAAVFAKQFGSVHSFVPARLVSFGGVAAFSSALYGGLSYNAWAPLVAVCIVLFLAVRGKPMFMGKFLGGMSYPLYLNHWIGVFVGHALMSPFGMRDTMGRHVFSAILNLGIAASLYWCVDRRIVAMRGQLFTGERGKLTMHLGYGLVAVGIVGGLILTAFADAQV